MGVMLEEQLCEKVIEIKMVSDRAMAVVAIFKDDVLRLIYGYVLQGGRKTVFL